MDLAVFSLKIRMQKLNRIEFLYSLEHFKTDGQGEHFFGRNFSKSLKLSRLEHNYHFLRQMEHFLGLSRLEQNVYFLFLSQMERFFKRIFFATWVK